MDIRCTKCGEPWDIDCIHDEIQFRHADTRSDVPRQWRTVDGSVYDGYFNEVRDDFRNRGCVALGGSRCDGSAGPLSAAIAAAAFELMGDDIDGVASMLDDAGSMGLI